MYCFNCGTNLEEGNDFCPNCGKPAGEKKNHSVVAASANSAAAASASAVNAVPTIALAAMALVTIVVVACCAFFATGAFGADKAVAGIPVVTQATPVATTVVTTPAPAPTVNKGGYVLPDSNSRYFSKAEFYSMSLVDLYHARNEIYARHGRGFVNTDLQAYFGSQSWYRCTVSPEHFNEGVLSKIEKANANLMLEVEKERNSPYLA